MQAVKTVCTCVAIITLTTHVHGQSTTAVQIGLPTTPYPLVVVSPHPVGAGWTFTPTADLVMTDLGKAGAWITSPMEVVRLWDASGGLLLSTTNFTGSPDASGIIYSPVAPVTLLSGQSYLIDISPGDGFVLLGAYTASTSAPTETEFKLAPHLSGFSCALLLSPGQLDPQSLTSSHLLLGPTFRYYVIPEPGVGSFLIFGACLVLYGVKRNT